MKDVVDSKNLDILRETAREAKNIEGRKREHQGHTVIRIQTDLAKHCETDRQTRATRRISLETVINFKGPLIMLISCETS